MNDPLDRQITDFLVVLGIAEMSHTGKTYYGHLLAVRQLMHEQGCSLEVCRAGIFHSIYGTEEFQRFQLPLEKRSEVSALIGERAERLAYLNCAMDRASFDRALMLEQPPYPMRDRFTDTEVLMDREEFDDLCRIHLYDWLEQVPRSRRGYGYRREAYRRIAERLDPEAVLTFDRFYAEEPGKTI